MKILAIYVFCDAKTADHALDQLWRNVSQGIERSGGCELWISSDCNDPNLAGRICISLGGVPK